MRVLITGGAGFLGYHLANYLSNQGLTVTLLDIAPFIKADCPANTVFENVDIRDEVKVNSLLSDTEFIVHAAAALPLWPKKEIYSINIEGTRNILEAALKSGGVRRLVYISSTAVYGIPEKHPIQETDPLVGVGPYGESKIAAEKICLEYIKKGLNVSILRPKTFLGPGRLGVFQILYDWVKSGKRIPIIGSGENRYQLLAVEDLTEGIYKLMLSQEIAANDTFNIGAELFDTIKSDVGALCRYANNGSKVWPLPAKPVKTALRILELLKLSPLYQWVYETADKDSFVSIEKIKSIIGYKPRFSNHQTLINSYQWYLDHLHEIEGKSGITHRVAWDQGLLKLLKNLL